MIRNPNISFFQKIVYSLWAVLGLAGCMGSSPCAASSGCSSAHVRAPHCAGSSGCSEQGLLLSIRAGSSLCWLLWLHRAAAAPQRTCGLLTAVASLAAASRGHQARGLQQVQFSGFRTEPSRAVHDLSCSKAHGIFPNQGSKPCLLHWQADSLPLSHQGSPRILIYPSITAHIFK